MHKNHDDSLNNLWSMARGYLIGIGYGFEWANTLDESRFPDYFTEYEGISNTGWLGFVTDFWENNPVKV